MSKSNRENKNPEGQPRDEARQLSEGYSESGEPDHEDFDENEQPGAYSSDEEEEFKSDAEGAEPEPEIVAGGLQPGERDLNLETELSCPVTQYIFLEPVVIIPTGITLEREYAEYLVRHHLGYPLHNSNPKVTDLREDAEMKERVSHYLNEHPEAQPNQYQRGFIVMPAPPVDEPEDEVADNIEGRGHFGLPAQNGDEQVDRVLELGLSDDIQVRLNKVHEKFKFSPPLERQALAKLVVDDRFQSDLLTYLYKKQQMPVWPVPPDYEQLGEAIIASPYMLGRTRATPFWSSFPQGLAVVEKAKAAMKELHETEHRKLTVAEKNERAILAGDAGAKRTVDEKSQQFYNNAIMVLQNYIIEKSSELNDKRRAGGLLSSSRHMLMKSVDGKGLMRAELYMQLLKNAVDSPFQQFAIISAVMANDSSKVLKKNMEQAIDRDQLKAHLRERMIYIYKKPVDVIDLSFYREYVTPINVKVENAGNKVPSQDPQKVNEYFRTELEKLKELEGIEGIKFIKR